MAENAKSEKMEHVAACLLKIISQSGVDSLNYSRLAKRAGVSRSWLYKYVGATRDDLFAFAVTHFGMLFTDLKPPQVDLTRDAWLGQIGEGFSRFLTLTERHPGVLLIYFRYRGTPGVIGRTLQAVLGRHTEREKAEIVKIFGRAPREASLVAETLDSLRLGLGYSWSFGDLRGTATAPDLATIFRKTAAMLLG